MKARLFFLVLGAFATTAVAQDVSSTSTLTSGGLNAGTLGTSGTYFGYEAGNSVIPGPQNRGQRNTFIGHQAGKANGVAQDNTYVGFSSGSSASGFQNCFFGAATGVSTSGSENTFVGRSSGNSFTTGDGNTFMGSYSGLDSGSYNTTIGSYSGEDSSGDENLYLGFFAGALSTGSRNVFIGFGTGYGLTTSNKLIVSGDDSQTPIIYGDFTTNKVGIGNVTTFPSTVGGVDVSGYRLFVDGGILTDEVRVATTWADYVFEPQYKLPTLEEVEAHIAQKGHLINVPSAKTVEAQGISLGEMAKIQQEKIEELTLYILEQHKLNKKQEAEIAELKTMVQQLIDKK